MTVLGYILIIVPIPKAWQWGVRIGQLWILCSLAGVREEPEEGNRILEPFIDRTLKESTVSRRRMAVQ